MRKWHARLGERDVLVHAERIQQIGDYVSLYAETQVVGLIRLGAGDSIVEVTTPQ